MEKVVIEQIFLNGMPEGMVQIRTDNWSGLCFKIPYVMIGEVLKVEETKCLKDSPATYLLFGENDGHDCVYVGETETPIKRLNQHKTDDLSGLWNYALVFVSGVQSDPLNKGQIGYIEHALYEECFKAYEANKIYEVLNSKSPRESTLSGATRIKTDKFIKNIKFLVNALGYKLFIEKEIKTDNSTLFSIKRNGIEAYGERTFDGFVVKKGSTTADNFTESTTECFKLTGKRLRDEGIIVNNKFVVDYTFKTPSGASTMILGHNSNGLIEWKRDDKSLKEIENNQ